VAEPESKHPSDDFFARLEQAKLEEQRNWFRTTTPGQRVDVAIDLSRLACEVHADAPNGGD
jgi:hypothetical protein